MTGWTTTAAAAARIRSERNGRVSGGCDVPDQALVSTAAAREVPAVAEVLAKATVVQRYSAHRYGRKMRKRNAVV